MLDLEDQHVEEGLDTVEAAVDIITHEEVVGVLSYGRGYGESATDFEYLEQVIELSVDIAADGDGCSDLHHVGFFDENFFNLR
jgi:hypothetical protein